MLKKFYNEPLIEVINIFEDVIRTSKESDGFNDGWEDSNVK